MQATELLRDRHGEVVNSWPINGANLRLVSPASRTPDRYWVQVIHGQVVVVFAENEILVETMEL